MYAEAPFFEMISKGPVRLSASFFFGRGRLRLVVLRQTLSPTWYSIAGCFFLFVLGFHLVGGFLSDVWLQRVFSASVKQTW